MKAVLFGSVATEGTLEKLTRGLASSEALPLVLHSCPEVAGAQADDIICYYSIIL